MQETSSRDKKTGLQMPTRRPLAGIVLTTLILILSVGLLGWWFVSARTPAVEVPELIGLTLSEATARAQSAGLGLMPVDEEGGKEAEDPSALIRAQQPDPGSRTTKGQAIVVTLAAEPQSFPMPDLDGLDLSQATDALVAAGLALEDVIETGQGSGRPGDVVQQEPAAGREVSAGRRVVLWTLTDLVPVPRLVGQTAEEAGSSARDSGFELQLLEENSDEGLPGTIVRQTPSPGKKISRGARVVCVVNATLSAKASDAEGAAPKTLEELYRSLASWYSFPVLCPGEVPGELRLAGTSENPRHVASTTGVSGFEVTYKGSSSGSELVVMEGNWIDPPGGSEEESVQVRGYGATLFHEGDEIVLFWEERGIRYALRGYGLEESIVIAIANQMQVVEE